MKQYAQNVEVFYDLMIVLTDLLEPRMDDLTRLRLGDLFVVPAVPYIVNYRQIYSRINIMKKL